MNKVLVIEDDPLTGRIYRTRLTQAGFQVQIATDGLGGLQTVPDFQPEIVLLDLMLPNMNGIDILKTLRAELKSSQLPIIVFTSAYVPDMIDKALLAGATLVFNKATTPPIQIVDAMRNALTRSAPGSVAPGSAPKPPPEAAVAKPVGPAAPANPGLAEFREKLGAGDTEFQKGLLREFLESSPEILINLRQVTQEVCKGHDEESRQKSLLELYRKVHGLSGGAALAGLRNISRLAAALEVLVKELQEHPRNFNGSSMRTVAHAIDLLIDLLKKMSQGDVIEEAPFNILVVDDQEVTRRAIVYSLGKAGLRCASADTGESALTAAAWQRFDLVFLDILMPGMDGFELCGKIRELPMNKNTLVIFVTTLNDFQSRAKASLSGGIDLIAKPFMFIELSVKALVLLMRAKLLSAAKAPSPSESVEASQEDARI